jgi:hypothetical protein
MEEHRGFELTMGGVGAEQTRSVLKPYGVWAVVAPFNFPIVLGAGMAAGALVAGNTVVFKPASDTPLSGVCLYEVLRDAGLPAGVFNLITGPGDSTGRELVENSGVDGFIFTGSRVVGLRIQHRFTRSAPKPCITEMGGKNPAIVMPSSDLDDATEGVMRSAFGMGWPEMLRLFAPVSPQGCLPPVPGTARGKDEEPQNRRTNGARHFPWPAHQRGRRQKIRTRAACRATGRPCLIRRSNVERRRVRARFLC